MKIAILVWGSLHWNPGALAFGGTWHSDGPELPIEFARISKDKRLTLVIRSGSGYVISLYAISSFDNLEAARANLQEREGAEKIDSIAFINFQDDNSKVRQGNNFIIPIIKQWNKTGDFDAVIWSDFSPKFKDVTGNDLTSGNVISYLESLSSAEFQDAIAYIRNAPAQINTDFRSQIEKHFPDNTINKKTP